MKILLKVKILHLFIKSKNENLNLPNYDLTKNDTIIKTHMKKNSDEINSNFTSINVNISDPNNNNAINSIIDIDKKHNIINSIKNSSNFNNDSNINQKDKFYDSNLPNKNSNLESIISNSINNNYNKNSVFENEKKNSSILDRDSSKLKAENFSSNELDNLINEAKLSEICTKTDNNNNNNYNYNNNNYNYNNNYYNYNNNYNNNNNNHNNNNNLKDDESDLNNNYSNVDDLEKYLYKKDVKSHFQDSFDVEEDNKKEFKEQPENQNGNDFEDNFDDEDY